MSKIIVMKAEVIPSQRLNDEPHVPWIAINETTASVAAAHCNCMAGLGESCSLIGALLFKIEVAVHTGYTKKSACTEVACKWNDDFSRK